MNDDLSMLPADVQGAVSVADQWAGTYEHGFSAKNEWDTIRAELLRLARENAELHAFRAFRDAFSNSELRFFIEKHGEPVPIVLRAERAEAELAKLRAENADLHESALGGYEDGWHALRNERDALKAELSQLKARIAEAPVATLVHGNGELLVAVSAEDPDDWAGKTVRLLVEDEE